MLYLFSFFPKNILLKLVSNLNLILMNESIIDIY